MPIAVPAGVEVKIEPTEVKVKGPKGELSEKIAPGIKVSMDDGVITVAKQSDSKLHRALHGLTRTLVSNMVVGVSEGFSKTLEIV
jgi:large subunit ribosomal protein L6